MPMRCSKLFMPASDISEARTESGTWPSKSICCFFASSAMARTPHFRHSALIICSSSRVNTLPVGLVGVLITIARVLSLNAAASTPGSIDQSGARRLEETRAEYAASGVDPARWRVEAFLTDMPSEYAAADLVLARSGSTIAELCAAGKPSVLVPLPTAADDHQRKNAEVLAGAGAAVMLLQQDLTPEAMEQLLVDLLLDGDRRRMMAEAAKRLARPGALERVIALPSDAYPPIRRRARG